MTSKQDTILHIHFNSTAVRSAEFAHKVFDTCPQLVKQTIENGDTPLHIAARNNHSNMVRLLVQFAKTRDLESGQEAGAEAKQLLTMVNNSKDTALHEAVRWDNFNVVEEILAEEDLEYKYGVSNSGETPLYLAAHCSAFSSLDAMLKAYQHKPVAYQGPNEKTVLHAAIVFCSNHPDVASKTIESMGSLVNEADENGWSTLLCGLYSTLFFCCAKNTGRGHEFSIYDR